MALLFANNASSKLATGINDSATSLSVTAGEGAKFPTITGGNTCMITVQDSTGAYEIMSCTARSTDTLTVVRAQEGTTARAFSSGATVANRFTAGTMTGYAQTSAVQPVDATLTALSGVTVAADKLIYATGDDAFSTTDLTSAARTVLDDATTSDMRTTLGLAIGTNVQAYDADLAAIAGLTSAAGKSIRYTGAGTAETIGITDFAKTFLDDVDAAAVKTTLGITASSGGMWEKVGTTTTISDVATVDWTGLDGATYDYQLRLNGVVPTTVDGILKLQFGYGATPTYITASYAQGVTLSNNDPAVTAVGGTLTGCYLDTLCRKAHGFVEIMTDGSAVANAIWQIADGSRGASYVGGGGAGTVSSLTALRLLMSANNLASGKVSLYRRTV